jgi:tetratricopeptide (TPR) repeat protein
MKNAIIISLVILIAGMSHGTIAQNFKVMLQTGDKFLAESQYDSALAWYNKAIKLDRGKPDGYIKRADAYMAKQRYDNAIVDYSIGISMDMKNGEAYYKRGLARKAKGSNAANFCDDFIKAKELGYKEAKKAVKEFCKDLD